MECLEFTFEFPLEAVKAVDLAAQVIDSLPQFDEISFSGAAGAFGLFSLHQQLFFLALENSVAFFAVKVLLAKRIKIV